MPAADTGLLTDLDQRHRRAGEGDASLLAEIHLMLDPGTPVADELGLVEKQILGPISLWFALAPCFEHGIDPGELEDGVVEGGIEDVGGSHAIPQQRIGSLQHQRSLADLPSTGNQDSTRCGRIGQPPVQFPKGRAPPFRQVGNDLVPPPRVELGQDSDKLFF